MACKLLYAEPAHDGFVWEPNIPAECYACIGRAAALGTLRVISHKYEAPEQEDEGALEGTNGLAGGFRNIGLQVVRGTIVENRVFKEEVGVERDGDLLDYVVDETSSVFTCFG